MNLIVSVDGVKVILKKKKKVGSTGPWAAVPEQQNPSPPDAESLNFWEALVGWEREGWARVSLVWVMFLQGG